MHPYYDRTRTHWHSETLTPLSRASWLSLASTKKNQKWLSVSHELNPLVRNYQRDTPSAKPAPYKHLLTRALRAQPH